MNLQSFKTSPREITFDKLLKIQYKLLPFGALCNLIPKMHQNFGQLNLCMLISFIILYMIDLYKDNLMCASLHP